MDKISHQLIMKTKYRLNKSQVLESCEITEDEYNELQFAKAIEWIKYRVHHDEDVVSAICSKQMFWTWWQNQWNLREDEFITDNIDLILSKFHGDTRATWYLKDVWMKVHEVQRMVAYPSHAMLLEKALSEVVDELATKKEATI